MNGSLSVFSSLSKGVTEKFVKQLGDSVDSLYTHFPGDAKLLSVRRFSADNEGAAKRKSETKKRHTKVCFYVLNICYHIRQLFGMEQHQKPWIVFLKKNTILVSTGSQCIRTKEVISVHLMLSMETNAGFFFKFPGCRTQPVHPLDKLISLTYNVYDHVICIKRVSSAPN